MSWKLDPPAVKKVLDDTSATMKNDDNKALLDVDLKDFGTAITVGGQGALGLVPAAVQSLLEREGTNFTIVGNRFRAALEGTTLAAVAYQTAQQNMVDTVTLEAKCSEFESAGIKAAGTGDFSFFAQYENPKGS